MGAVRPWEEEGGLSCDDQLIPFSANSDTLYEVNQLYSSSIRWPLSRPKTVKSYNLTYIFKSPRYRNPLSPTPTHHYLLPIITG